MWSLCLQACQCVFFPFDYYNGIDISIHWKGTRFCGQVPCCSEIQWKSWNVSLKLSRLSQGFVLNKPHGNNDPEDLRELQQRKDSQKQIRKKTPNPSKQIMMFTFICQFVWAMMPSYLVKHYSGSFYKGVFEWGLHLNWWILSKRNYPPAYEWSEVKWSESLSRVQLFATPWTVAHQAPLSMGFSRQEYWSGLPFPSPGDLSDPGIKPRSPALQVDALTSEPPGKHMSRPYLIICRTE